MNILMQNSKDKIIELIERYGRKVEKLVRLCNGESTQSKVHLALIAVRESRPVAVETVNVFFALADAGVRQTLRVVVQTTGLRTVAHSATNITHTNSHTKDDLLVVKRQPILNY